MVGTDKVKERLARKVARLREAQTRFEQQEPPFSRALRTWLVRIRHKRTLERNEDALLIVQNEFEKGCIKAKDLRLRIRKIVHNSELIHSAFPRIDSKKNPFVELFHSFKQWYFLLARQEQYVEVLCAPKVSDLFVLDDSSIIFSYELTFDSVVNASAFLFGLVSLVKRQNSEIQSIKREVDLPDVPFDSLINLEIKNNKSSKLHLRWLEIVEEQKPIMDKLNRSFSKLQRRLKANLSEICIKEAIEAFEKEKGPPRRRKKRKKKKLTPAVVPNEKYNDHDKLQNSYKPDHAKDPCSEAAERFKETSLDNQKHQCQRDDKKITGKYFRVKPSEVQLYMIRPALNLLCEEMVDLHQSITKIVQKKDGAKRWVVQKLQSEVETVFSCAKVHIFGSYATGLALPSSDIDCFYCHIGGEQNLLHCEATNAEERFGNIDSAGKQRHGKQAGVVRCSMYFPVYQQLEFLRQALWRRPYIKNTKILRSAMPILRLQVCREGDEGVANYEGKHLCPKCFMVDLSYGHYPGHTNFASVHFVNHFAEQFPYFRSLTLVLKLFLHERELNCTYKGGLGSFHLCILVIAFCKLKSRIKGALNKGKLLSVDSKHINEVMQSEDAAYRHTRESLTYARLNSFSFMPDEEYKSEYAEWESEKTYGGDVDDYTLGSLFLEFLDFYGNKFDPTTHGVSVGTYSGFFQLPSNMYPPIPLWIDNPFWPGRNIAGGVFQAQIIFEVFRYCHRILEDRMNEYSKTGSSQHDSILRSIFSTKWGHRSRRILLHAVKNKQFTMERR